MGVRDQREKGAQSRGREGGRSTEEEDELGRKDSQRGGWARVEGKPGGELAQQRQFKVKHSGMKRATPCLW